MNLLFSNEQTRDLQKSFHPTYHIPYADLRGRLAEFKNRMCWRSAAACPPTSYYPFSK
jgi:hypothetical protein